mgnify:CR=1 FL=1
MYDLKFKKKEVDLKILNAFKEAKNYTKFSHYNELLKILDKNDNKND